MDDLFFLTVFTIELKCALGVEYIYLHPPDLNSELHFQIPDQSFLIHEDP